jgi:hypothetical protein
MPEIHSAVATKLPSYAVGKAVDLNWSNKQTKEMAEEVGMPGEFHAAAFNYTSRFVHPSALFLLRHLSQGEGGTVQISATDQDEDSLLSLRLAHPLS